MVTARSAAGAVLQSIQLPLALTQGNTTGGNNLIFTSGDQLVGEDGVAGGNLQFVAGASSAPASDGGDLILTATASTGGGAGGTITITGGDSNSGNGGDIQLNPGGSTSGTAGLLALGGSGTLQFAGRAATLGTPAAGNGRLWVSSAASPSTLVFTDDTGVDTVLGAGGAGTLAATLVLGNSTGGTAIITDDNAGGDADDLVLTGGAHTGASGTSTGSDVLITAGASDAPTGRGGFARLRAGAGTGGASSGNLEILGATATGSGAADDLIFIRSSSLANRSGSTIQLGGSSGDILIQGSTATGGNENGSSVTIAGGTGNGSGNGGSLTFTTGVSGLTGDSGSISFSVGGAGADGGDITMDAGDSPADPGNITLTAGEHTGGDGAVSGGLVQLIPGNGNGQGGGTSIIRSGFGSGGGSEGNIYIAGATATASTVPAGEIVIVGSPVTDRGGSSMTIAQSTGQLTLLTGSATGSNLSGAPLVLATGVGNGSGDGGNLTFTASPGGATGNGGDFNFTAGSGGATSGNGGNITFTPGAAPSGTAGQFILNGDFDATGTVESAGLVIDEAADHPEDPTGGTQGALWIRNDNPNVLVFTDNAGTDTVLGAGGALATVLGVGNTTGGTSILMTSGDSILGETAAAGGALTLTAGESTGDNQGGNVLITGGAVSGGTNVNGGDVQLLGGTPTNTSGDGGSITLTGGPSNGTSSGSAGGDITLTGGTNSGGNGRGGTVTIQSGPAGGAFSANPVALIGGDSDANAGGAVTLTGGGGEDGGNIELKGGLQTQTGGGSRSGEVNLESGDIDTGVNGTFGDINIRVPDAGTAENRGAGDINIQAGRNGTRSAAGGSVNITAGDTYTFSFQNGGDINLTAGSEQGNGNASAEGGSVIVTPGDGVANGYEGVFSVLGSSTIELTERAAAITTPLNAGEGRIWIRSDTPNTLMFTDDAGTDYPVAGSAVTSSSTFADVLAAGSDTGGNEITTADNAAGSANNMRFTGGAHTGAAAGQDGASLVLNAGDRNSASGSSGSILLTAGDSTAGGDYGGITLTTRNDAGPIAMQTHSASAFAARQVRTYHQSILVPFGGADVTLMTLASLTAAGQNVSVEITAVAHDQGTTGAIVSFRRVQTYLRSGAGLNSVTANVNSQEQVGIYSDIEFDTSPSGASDVLLVVRNNSVGTNYTPTITLHVVTQRGGAA